MRRSPVTLAAVCLLAASGPARAGTSDRPRPVRPVAVAAAVFPGLLYHGLGHRLSGEPAAARRLLLLQGVGLGTAATGGLMIALTGASRYMTPGIPLIFGGFGLFLSSWFSDIYGTAGGGHRGARPRLALPAVELRTGYAFVRDPQFPADHFALISADLWWRSLRASPAAWLAIDGDERRLRAGVAHRLLGPRGDRPAADGSWLEVEAGFVHHHNGSEHFSVATGELLAAGRLDLAQVAGTLAGSFAELAIGLGIDRIRYPDVAVDWTTQLLGRVAWGLYLGDPQAAGGELALYYDHRRDDFAGGLALGGGFLGYYGVGGVLRLGNGWGVTAAAELGSANLVRAGLVRRLGAAR